MKILYLMNCDWAWIAQRPHLLARALDQRFELTVLYPRYLVRGYQAQRTTARTRDCRAVRQLPWQERIAVFRQIQKWIFRRRMGDVSRYDVLWLSTPAFYPYIPKEFRGLVVYDCMDDVVALQRNKAVAAYMRRCSEATLRRADYVLASSRFLCERLRPYEKKVLLVRNGFQETALLPPEPARCKETYLLGYVGTIAEWMDWPLLRRSLMSFPKLRYAFWGPQNAATPDDERLELRGVAEHGALAQTVREADCLLMPFVLNEITLAVDPVKLYEYISYGKCIIAVRYAEIERFEPFVYFYSGQEEYLRLLGELMEKGFPPKYTKEQQEAFLRDNTWECRARQVEALLKSKER